MYDKRIKKIGNSACDGFVDTEFGKNWLIEMMLEPWPEDFWEDKGVSAPTSEEAEQAFQYLKDAGRIIADVTDIKHRPSIEHEDHCMFIPTDFYPRRTKAAREFKKTQEYKYWLKKRKGI